ncbi:MAG TPA: 1-(5-phosphoribosyl)-5-[(5-phosphoribosylamino)methylideneamino]imidazole-4-carboxamide isomerase [Actinomycetota bacterium]|nr:1-(5-phosphoribosyl)-5-[(5-phosphoribosylamino)methylideneamino]imidazole-4-carboxamide isomerase [Actinomycetota bacterium]
MSRPPVILVAVDMVAGEVVRLTKGDMGAKTVYGQDPVRAAEEWIAKGARWLHLVDLDGATGTGIDNSGPIGRILDASTVPVQIGGGIRSMDAVARWVERGAARVCIGTKSLDFPWLAGAAKEFGDKLVASLDTRGGTVRVAGWTEGSGMPTLEALRRMLDCGVSRVMFTDIDRDGTLTGPNVEAVEEVLDAAGVPVIAAGGVTTTEDLERLAALAPKGLEGVVVGKALYSGSIDLAEAQNRLAALAGA